MSMKIHHNGFEEYCSPVYNWSGGIYNCTWNISGNPPGWYNVTIEANRTLYNPDIKEERSFFHETDPVIYGAYTDKDSVVWGTDVSKSRVTFPGLGNIRSPYN